MNIKRMIYGIFAVLFVLSTPNITFAKAKNPYQIPKHVVNISQENTLANTPDVGEIIEPSEQTKEWIKESRIKINNPQLVKMLNETSIKPSVTSFGYRGMIYLGHWSIDYTSEETSINWQYKKINENKLANINEESRNELTYAQVSQNQVAGHWTRNIEDSLGLKQMIVNQTKAKTKLPIATTVAVGQGTKTKNPFVVPLGKTGYLEAFVPAVHEKGEVTYGEVFMELKGSKVALVVKNITKQNTSAWMPVQDHVSLSLLVK